MQTIVRMRSELKQLLKNVLTKPCIEREAAFCIDVAICATLAIFPTLGPVAALLYFFFRDCLPFRVPQSFGKQIYSLRIVRNAEADGRVPRWQTSVIRNLILVIPLLNLVDFWRFAKRGRRLADDWTGTHVIKDDGVEG